MANKTTANAFMASAQKSKREMADIQKEGSGKHETRWNSRKSVSSSRLGSTKKRNSTASRRGRA